jgi:hypothetical protein
MIFKPCLLQRHIPCPVALTTYLGALPTFLLLLTYCTSLAAAPQYPAPVSDICEQPSPPAECYPAPFRADHLPDQSTPVDGGGVLRHLLQTNGGTSTTYCNWSSSAATAANVLANDSRISVVGKWSIGGVLVVHWRTTGPIEGHWSSVGGCSN